MRYRGIFASSSDPSGQTMSETIVGVLTSASGLAVLTLIASIFGVHPSPADLVQLVTLVGSLVSSGVAFYGVCKTVIGLIKKIINTYGTQPTQ